MKKLTGLILAMLLICGSAGAETIHVERQLTDMTSVDAEIVLPDVEAGAALTMHRPNLAAGEGIDLDTAADYFWSSDDAPRERYKYESEYLAYHGPEYGGECVSVQKCGCVIYCMKNAIDGYMSIWDSMIMGVRDYPWMFEQEVSWVESLTRELDSYSLEQAEAKAREAMILVMGEDNPLKPELLYWYALTDEQCAESLRMVRAWVERTSEGLPHFSDAEEEEPEEIPLEEFEWQDVYMMQFGFRLDDIPLLIKTTGVEWNNEDYFLCSLEARVVVGPEGFASFDMYYAEPLESEEKQTLMNAEQALEAVKRYFESIIETKEQIITEGHLEYLTMMSVDDPEKLDVIPVWAFTFDWIFNGKRYENQRVLRFNAVTGEFLL